MHKRIDIKNILSALVILAATAIVFTIASCNTPDSKNTIKITPRKLISEEGMTLLTASEGGGFGTFRDCADTIYAITTDKVLTVSNTVEYIDDNDSDILPIVQRTLDDSEYEELLSVLDDNKALQLPHDLSDDSVLDGSSASIIFYLDNGKTYEVGGYMPYHNKRFNNVLSFIKSLETKEMRKERDRKTDAYYEYYDYYD